MPDQASVVDRLDELIHEREIIVCVGGGGVGKTTLAATLAIRGAQLGRRSVVVTIDPARRLADALGIDTLPNDPLTIDHPDVGAGAGGSLAALMLDAKATFDDLVREHARDDLQPERILTNRFYRSVSEGLSGTQEYMAMEKLASLHRSGNHDLIVVDTPPHRHALDVLDASDQLSRLLDNRLFQFLIVPQSGLARRLGRASRTLIRSLAQIVGADVIDDAVAFFSAFEGMEEGFRRRSHEARRLLAGDATAFVVVCAPRNDALADAVRLGRGLADAGIEIDATIVNRVLPSFGDDDPGELADMASGVDDPVLAELLLNLSDLRRVSQTERTLIAQVHELLGVEPVTIPLLDDDIHNIEALASLADVVFARAG